MGFDLESHSASNVTGMGTRECHGNRREGGTWDGNVTRELGSTDLSPLFPSRRLQSCRPNSIGGVARDRTISGVASTPRNASSVVLTSSSAALSMSIRQSRSDGILHDATRRSLSSLDSRTSRATVPTAGPKVSDRPASSGSRCRIMTRSPSVPPHRGKTIPSGSQMTTTGLALRWRTCSNTEPRKAVPLASASPVLSTMLDADVRSASARCAPAALAAARVVSRSAVQSGSAGGAVTAGCRSSWRRRTAGSLATETRSMAFTLQLVSLMSSCPSIDRAIPARRRAASMAFALRLSKPFCCISATHQLDARRCEVSESSGWGRSRSARWN